MMLPPDPVVLLLNIPALTPPNHLTDPGDILDPDDNVVIKRLQLLGSIATHHLHVRSMRRLMRSEASQTKRKTKMDAITRHERSQKIIQPERGSPGTKDSWDLE